MSGTEKVDFWQFKRVSNACQAERLLIETLGLPDRKSGELSTEPIELESAFWFLS